MITRAFSVRATKKNLVCCLTDKLDEMLCNLQKNGWDIILVTSTPVKEYAYPDYFDSTLFTIIAKHT